MNFTRNYFVSLLFLIWSLEPVDSSSILLYTAFGSYSHKIAMWPLAESLVARGHQVTFLSAFDKKPSPNANITDYNPKMFTEWFLSADEEYASRIFDGRSSLSTKIMDWVIMIHLGVEVCEKQLRDPEFIAWVHRSQFDLVIIDVLFNDCAYGLAAHFKAATILYSTSTLYPWNIEQFGLQSDASWIPDTVFPGNGDAHGVSFFGRVWGTLHPMLWQFGRTWFYFDKLDVLFAETLGNTATIAEVEQETSLMFINTHFSEDYARALPPFVIPVGGAQCDTGKNGMDLPKEIADFIGSDDRDVVYISFGSFADMHYHPILQALFTQAFREMSHLKFILKTKGAGTGELQLPENVLALKWSPQKELLKHPKVRAFISHCGLLGTHEAICAGVPIIAMPVFAEQDYNAVRVQRNGYGLQLESTTVTKDELVEAINRVTSDPSFTANIKAASQVFSDRRESGTETATWWTEYVLRRHRYGDELSVLKPLSRHQTWYERRLLDVWAFIFATVAIVLLAAFLVLKSVVGILIRIVFPSPNAATRKKTKTS